MTSKTAINCKLLLIVCNIFIVTAACAASVGDTSIKKSSVSTTRNSFNITDNYNVFKDAAEAFKKDSLDKGIQLLQDTLKRAEASRKISRAMDYHWLELWNFVNEAEDGNLGFKEKHYLQNFVAAIVLQKSEGELKTLESHLKEAKVYRERLKLYFVSLYKARQVEADMGKVLMDNPELLSINVLRAEWLYAEKKYDECIQSCTKLIAISPEYAHAYELMGDCFLKLDKLQQASENFNKSLKLFPANNTLFYDIGCIAMGDKDYRGAVTNLLKMHKANPDYLWTNFNLATCYNKLNLVDSALYFVELHIKHYPKDDDGYDLKGDIYYGKGTYPAAVEQYSKAIKLNPSKEIFYEDRGDAFFYAEKFKESLKDFQKAVTLTKPSKTSKGNPYALDRIGDCYYQLMDFDKSIKSHQEALKIDPSYKYAYEGLSLSKVELADYQGAISDCKKALAIDSTFDNAISNMGWIYYCSGDYDNCIAYSLKALQRNEKLASAMFNIALATLRKGEVKRSVDLYTRYIAECKEKGYPINESAIDDLKTLIKYNIYVEDCRYIIEQLFERKYTPETF